MHLVDVGANGDWWTLLVRKMKCAFTWAVFFVTVRSPHSTTQWKTECEIELYLGLIDCVCVCVCVWRIVSVLPGGITDLAARVRCSDPDARDPDRRLGRRDPGAADAHHDERRHRVDGGDASWRHHRTVRAVRRRTVLHTW